MIVGLLEPLAGEGGAGNGGLDEMEVIHGSAITFITLPKPIDGLETGSTAHTGPVAPARGPTSNPVLAIQKHWLASFQNMNSHMVASPDLEVQMTTGGRNLSSCCKRDIRTHPVEDTAAPFPSTNCPIGVLGWQAVGFYFQVSCSVKI